MIQYVQVTEEDGEEPIELPSEEDGTILLSTLAAQYPGACGLKYRNAETGAMRGIRLADRKLHPPDGHWGNTLYVCVFPKENKRKGDDGLDNPHAKTKRVDKKKCSDLIVLGLPWKSTEDDIKKYFEQFGEVIMVQIKRDVHTKQSKGYGFIRFSEYESQIACLRKRHKIDGRWCEARIPNSKDGPRKVFVGRTTEDMTADDLRQYFSRTNGTFL
ncbi:TAR DNA-binding protein 43-like isoform X2 [Lineus longissimus]|uniref:TAR DNA-binding protein 43-like isoform X2 n=1 Tax=Lineus longissimus TaxID=88925 RepID=UPI00315D2299